MKMRTLTPVLLAGAMLLCTRTDAQVYVPNSTTPPGNARFEVLLVTGSIYRTHVKLDRYTGEVWSWSYQNGKQVWLSTLVEDPVNVVNGKGALAPRFQIFAPLTVEDHKTTILLDCQSGRTWDLALWKMENGTPRWKWVAYGSAEKSAEIDFTRSNAGGIPILPLHESSLSAPIKKSPEPAKKPDPFVIQK